MEYTIVRKFYNSIRDMNPDNPCKVIDIWTNKGYDPLTQEQAQIVLPKLIRGKLFLNEIQPVNKSMLHENNAKVLQNFTAKDFAEAYRDYVNNAYTLGEWVSIYFPEEVSDYDAMQILTACKRFHELGI